MASSVSDKKVRRCSTVIPISSSLPPLQDSDIIDTPQSRKKHTRKVRHRHRKGHSSKSSIDEIKLTSTKSVHGVRMFSESLPSNFILEDSADYDSGSDEDEIEATPLVTPFDKSVLSSVSSFDVDEIGEKPEFACIPDNVVSLHPGDFASQYLPTLSEGMKAADAEISSYQIPRTKTIIPGQGEPTLTKRRATDEDDQREFKYVCQMPPKFDRSSFTALVFPHSSEIKLNLEQHIEIVSEQAISCFQFGSIGEPDPDRFHLCAWHNLGHEPLAYAEFLRDSLLEADVVNVFHVKSALNYVFDWLNDYPLDFMIFPDVAAAISQLLEYIATNKRGSIQNRALALNSFVTGLMNREKTPFKILEPLKLTLLSVSKFTEGCFKALTVDPFCLAHHFMYLEANLVRHITRSEFVHLNWMNPDRKSIFCPYFVKYAEHFNTMVLTIVKTMKTEAQLEYWIQVMGAAWTLKNFLLFYEIDSALSHPEVISKCGRVNDSCKGQLQMMHEFTLPTSQQIAEMKGMILRSPRVTVPYLGLFMTDLYMRDQRSQKNVKLAQLDAINMKFQKECFIILDAMFFDWAIDFNFKVDPLLLAEIAKSGIDHSEDDLYGMNRFSSPS